MPSAASFNICGMLTVWNQITTEFYGRRVYGSYVIESETLTVKTPRGEKATRLGGSNPDWLAARLLRELAAEGKQKESGSICLKEPQVRFLICLAIANAGTPLLVPDGNRNATFAVIRRAYTGCTPGAAALALSSSRSHCKH